MKKMKPEKLKMLVTICIFVLVIIVLIIFLIILTHTKNNSSNENNILNEIDSNTIEENDTNSTDQNQTNSTLDKNETISNNVTTNETGTKSLKETTKVETYFMLKEILEKYYTSNELENPEVLIDADVIKELEITADNYKKYNNFNYSMFRIDEIYEQNIIKNVNAYVVKHRLGENGQDEIVWIKVDDNNGTFSIYPFEYLKIKKLTQVKEGDTILENTSSEIKKNSENLYTEKYDINTQNCMKDLFERYKFDLLVDQEHLYNTLSDEYKKAKFPTYNEFKQYIDSNTQDLSLEYLSKYNVTNYTSYVEYRATCNDNKKYVFNVVNMMNYKLALDNYSIVQSVDVYNEFLPEAQAKQCLNRVLDSIDYKDYRFIYNKLNQSEREYFFENSFNEFNDYIDQNSYTENSYEIDDNYIIVSDNTYKYSVTFKDKTENDFSYITYSITITLLENADFEIYIKV